MTHNIKSLIAGNWKMNGLRENLSQIKAISDALAAKPAPDVQVLICPPLTLLCEASTLCASGNVNIGAQNCHIAQSGAHTGDIGAKMLADAGAKFVIVGHSERRSDHHETDGVTNAKANSVLDAKLVPIICVGESLAERNSGLALTVVEKQLNGSVPELSDTQEIVIAYEPVWAIGTGLVPESNDISTMHGAIRDWLNARFGESGQTIAILYGGSLKPSNAAEILALPHVNGGLIGGASLKSDDFLGIIYAA